MTQINQHRTSANQAGQAGQAAEPEYITRYGITGVFPDYGRCLVFQGTTKPNEQEAKELLKAILKNNTAETISLYLGTDLQVRPVKCYQNGQPAEMYFNK